MLATPQGKVDYLLVDRTNADLILDRYPGADDGDVSGFDPVVSNDRYALIAVDPTVTTSAATESSSNGAGTSAPGTTSAPPANSTSAPPPSGG